MLNRLQFVRHGECQTLYRVPPDLRQKLPQYLVVAAPNALSILDQIKNNDAFPTIDVDALLSVAIDHFGNRAKSGRCKEAVLEAVHDVLMDCASVFHDGCVDRQNLTYAIALAFEALQLTFQTYRLYACDGVLLYDYLERRGQDAIVLTRKEFASFD